MVRLFLRAILLLILLFIFGVVVVGYVVFVRLFGDMPKISSISDYKPPSVSSVYANNGALIGEFFVERRYPIKIEQVPQQVKQAVLAAEDVAFYSHPGINPLSILRAALKNLESGQVAQGGSTITQQVVKNLLLSPEKTVERKLKEAILSYQLEKSLSKDDIFEIYLNQIYFGNGAYGIKAAAKEYFHKELDALTLAEAALLAGLPKAPSLYSPLVDKEAATRRRRYVLQRMVEAGFISSDESAAALREEMIVYHSEVEKRFMAAPYFLREFREQFKKSFPQFDLERDGLKVHTTLDLEADRLVVESLRRGLRSVDKRIGWRGPIASGVGAERFISEFVSANRDLKSQKYPEPVCALVTEWDQTHKKANVQLDGDTFGTVDLSDAEWANKRVDADGNKRVVPVTSALRVGDVIEVSGDVSHLSLDQKPEIEGAALLLNPNDGSILALQGGYSYVEGGFNRVTQAKRQPGSAFKSFVYLAAIKDFGYTPATIVQDVPRSFRVGTDIWEPKNYDGKYLGPITLQKGLEQSRNLIVADLISHFGVDPIIKLARAMGVQSELGRNLSLALGTSEVTLFELVRAYGVFAGGGVLQPTKVVTTIESGDGAILYSSSMGAPGGVGPKRVVDENSAFVLTHMLTGVVQRGTATKLKELGRPVAGKTGTTNDQMDAWFIGFTPRYVCGVWVGFDKRRNIGSKETGGKIAAPIWLDIMKGYLAEKEEVERRQRAQLAEREAEDYGITLVSQSDEVAQVSTFPVPQGVTPYLVNRYSGSETSREDPDGITMYFLKGSRPNAPQSREEQDVEGYLYGE
jgi:penicillin-binding protein 1A